MRAEDIERVLRRACDPLEHDGSTEVAEEFRTALNIVLEAEGLTITQIGGRPVMGQLGATGVLPAYGLTFDQPNLQRRSRPAITCCGVSIAIGTLQEGRTANGRSTSRTRCAIGSMPST